MITLAIGLLIGGLALHTPVYKECEKVGFKGGPCKISKELKKLESKN